MVQLVEVVHAVEVGIRLARVGRHIERERPLPQQHLLVHRHGQPPVGKDGGVPFILDGREEDLGTVEVQRRNAVRIRSDRVVPEVAHRLHPVLLVVLQAVAVEIHIAVDRAAAGHVHVERAERIARRVCPQVGGAVRAVHAVIDVGVAGHGGHGIGTRKVILPGVGQTVPVGIHRAGIEAGAAHAEGAVVRSRTVLQGRVAHRPPRAVFEEGDRHSRGRFEPVFQAVTVGIVVPRVGRPEFVDPLRVGRGTRDRDAPGACGIERGIRVGGAGVGAREFAAIDQERDKLAVDAHIAVIRIPRVDHHGARIRRAGHIQFPAVRHAIVFCGGGIAVRRARMRGERGPVGHLVTAAADRRARAVQTVLRHELHEQVFVERREGPGVRRR